MFCAKCGKKLSEGAKFCPECGAAVTVPSSKEDAPHNSTEISNGITSETANVSADSTRVEHESNTGLTRNGTGQNAPVEPIDHATVAEVSAQTPNEKSRKNNITMDISVAMALIILVVAIKFITPLFGSTDKRVIFFNDSEYTLVDEDQSFYSSLIFSGNNDVQWVEMDDPSLLQANKKHSRFQCSIWRINVSIVNIAVPPFCYAAAASILTNAPGTIVLPSAIHKAR